MSGPLRIWHPFSNELLNPAPIRVTHAEGVFLHTADGRKIIDAISSWWVNLHGHGIRASPLRLRHKPISSSKSFSRDLRTMLRKSWRIGSANG